MESSPYKHVRSLIGRYGISNLLYLLTQVASGFGEGVTEDGRRYKPDPTWLAIAAQLSQCADAVDEILRNDPSQLK